MIKDLFDNMKAAIVAFYAGNSENVPAANIHLLDVKALRDGEIVTPAILIDIGDIRINEEEIEDSGNMHLAIPIDLHCVLSTKTADAEFVVFNYALQVASIVMQNSFTEFDAVTWAAQADVSTSPIAMKDGYHAKVVGIEIGYVLTPDAVQAFIDWGGYDGATNLKDVGDPTAGDDIESKVDFP